MAGTGSGRISGNRMTYTQDWITTDNSSFRSSFSLAARSVDTFTGSGTVSGFPGGARDRQCSIKFYKIF